jgi:hypothetical protein
MRALILASALVVATASPAFAAQAQLFGPQIRTEIYPARNQSAYGHLEDFFHQSAILDLVAEDLETRISLPSPVSLAAGECGEANAWHFPTQDAIIICYELVDAIFRATPEGTPRQRSIQAAWTVAFVLFHELGHRLVRDLDLKVSGKEEDAADQFATLSLLRVDPSSPLAAGVFFIRGNNGVLNSYRRHLLVVLSLHQDPHSTDIQRFFNIVCWTFGSDPTAFSEMGTALPSGRRSTCAQEYRSLSSAWTRVLSGHSREPVVGDAVIPQFGSLTGPWRFPASNEPRKPAPRVLLDLAVGSAFTGAWRFTERIGIAGRRPTCGNTGTLAMGNVGVMRTITFTGVQNCMELMPFEESDDRGFITRIRYTPTTIFFGLPPCMYSGTLTPDRTRFHGAVGCVVRNGNEPAFMAGTWEAVRQ